jgi:hypothetical protein
MVSYSLWFIAGSGCRKSTRGGKIICIKLPGSYCRR